MSSKRSMHWPFSGSISTNNFNGLLPTPGQLKPAHRLHDPAAAHRDLGAGDAPILPVPEPAAVLNIVLHIAYDLICDHYRPSLDTLSAAIDALATYGLPPSAHVTPATRLFTLIISQAPARPLVAYALAAAHDLRALAEAVSGYLLSYPLRRMPDALVRRMGALYFKRLVVLHASRLDPPAERGTAVPAWLRLLRRGPAAGDAGLALRARHLVRWSLRRLRRKHGGCAPPSASGELPA